MAACRAPADEVGGVLAHDRPRPRVRVDRERGPDSEVGLREEELPGPAAVAGSHAEVRLLARGDAAVEEDPDRAAAAFDLPGHDAVGRISVDGLPTVVDDPLADDMDRTRRSCDHPRIMRRRGAVPRTRRGATLPAGDIPEHWPSRGGTRPAKLSRQPAVLVPRWLGGGEPRTTRVRACPRSQPGRARRAPACS